MTIAFPSNQLPYLEAVEFGGVQPKSQARPLIAQTVQNSVRFPPHFSIGDGIANGLARRQEFVLAIHDFDLNRAAFVHVGGHAKRLPVKIQQFSVVITAVASEEIGS